MITPVEYFFANSGFCPEKPRSPIPVTAWPAGNHRGFRGFISMPRKIPQRVNEEALGLFFYGPKETPKTLITPFCGSSRPGTVVSARPRGPINSDARPALRLLIGILPAPTSTGGNLRQFSRTPVGNNSGLTRSHHVTPSTRRGYGQGFSIRPHPDISTLPVKVERRCVPIPDLNSPVSPRIPAAKGCRDPPTPLPTHCTQESARDQFPNIKRQRYNMDLQHKQWPQRHNQSTLLHLQHTMRLQQ